ncbi:MAG: hypothetical protein ACRYHA_30665 [Janthinobacterium lividum]
MKSSIAFSVDLLAPLHAAARNVPVAPDGGCFSNKATEIAPSLKVI